MNPLGHFVTELRRWYHIRFVRRLCRTLGIAVPSPLRFSDADVLNDIFFKRVYAPGFPFYQDCCIVDIGAHKGYFSLFAARFAGAGAVIHAVEPEPSNFAAMTGNLQANGVKNVSLHNCAIAGGSGQQQLFLGDTVNHSLIAADGTGRNGSRRGSISVEAFSLPDFLSRNAIGEVAFLKMDCEGAEYDILFGTDDATLGRIATIALEFHDIGDARKNIHTLSRFCAEKGYCRVATHFQETVRPLNMGVMTFSRQCPQAG